MYFIQEEPVTEGAALLNHSEGYCLKYSQSTVSWLLQLQRGEGGRRKKMSGDHGNLFKRRSFCAEINKV